MIEWSELFGLSISPLELIVRGSCMYWFLLVLFRFVLRRDIGTLGVADVLLLVIVADAAQNAMAGDYKTITDGMVLVGTIGFWNYGLDLLSYVSPRVRRFVQPPALLLVKDGRMLLHNCRRQFVSADELMGKVREKGIDKLVQVKRAYLETDGEISVIKRDAVVAGDVDEAKRSRQAG